MELTRCAFKMPSCSRVHEETIPYVCTTNTMSRVHYLHDFDNVFSRMGTAKMSGLKYYTRLRLEQLLLLRRCFFVLEMLCNNYWHVKPPVYERVQIAVQVF